MTAVRCTVTRGHFSDEYGVSIQDANGRSHTFITDQSTVAVEGAQPINGEDVAARLRVSVLREEAERLLVQLPATAAHISRIWISTELIAAD